MRFALRYATAAGLAFSLGLAPATWAAPKAKDSPTATLASSGDPKARADAATKLGASGDKTKRAALEAALDDGDPSVRKSAAAALAKLGDPAAIAALKVRAHKESDPSTKASLDAAAASLAAAAAGPAPVDTSAPTDWAKVKWVVVVTKVTNATGVRGDSLTHVLDAATRARLAGVPGVFVAPAGSGERAAVATAATKGLPVLGVDAGLTAIDQATSGADLKVHAKVSLAISKLSTVKAALDGSASMMGSPDAQKSPISLARLQDMAVDGAVASAMTKAAPALKAASGG